MPVLTLPLHKAQRHVFQRHDQLTCLVAGRGFGKTHFGFIRSVYRCLTNAERINGVNPQVCVIGMPLFNQARNAYWETILNVLEDQPYVKKIDRSNFRIKFKGKNTVDLLLKGADDNANKWRSLNILSALLDEYQDFGPEAWSKAIYPALSRNKTWDCIVIGTPKGKNNILYQMFEQANIERLHRWKAYQFRTRDNPLYPLESLREAKRVLPPKVYEQEYRASFINFDAQYYPSLEPTKHLLSMSLEEQKTVLAQAREVFLGVDWGDRHPAITVILITNDSSYFLLDAWQPDESVITTEVEFIQQASQMCRRYNVRRSFLPDDRPAMVKAFRVAGNQQGIEGMRKAVAVNRNLPGISEGNMIVDSLFYQDRLFINKLPMSCKLLHPTQLGDDFVSYHKDKVKGTSIILERPAPGQRNHLIDATRYVVATIEYKHHPLAQKQPTNQEVNGIDESLTMLRGYAA